MREYILTSKEKEAISLYLQNRIPNDYIHLIKHRAKANLKTLQEDVDLLRNLIENDC